MKEIPILFSTEMVQAEMSGRKKQTRRTKGLEQFNQDGSWVFEKIVQHDDPKLGLQAYFRADDTNHLYGARCPYGQVGDVLWVRETSCYVLLEHAHDLLEGAKDRNRYVYKASMHSDWMEYAKGMYGYKWTPAIHMPKAACRIKLRITNIRVERLQDITEQDAIDEGIKVIEKDEAFFDYMGGVGSYAGPIGSFYSLWISINGEDNFKSNPWVWVIEFERVPA